MRHKADLTGYNYCLTLLSAESFCWFVMIKDYHYVMYSVNRCKFAGKNCSTQMLKEIFTDMGRCYVFNNDPNNRQFSNASGR